MVGIKIRQHISNLLVNEFEAKKCRYNEVISKFRNQLVLSFC